MHDNIMHAGWRRIGKQRLFRCIFIITIIIIITIVIIIKLTNNNARCESNSNTDGLKIFIFSIYSRA